MAGERPAGVIYVFSCDVTIKQFWSAYADDEASARRIAARNAQVDEGELILAEVRTPEPRPEAPVPRGVYGQARGSRYDRDTESDNLCESLPKGRFFG